MKHAKYYRGSMNASGTQRTVREWNWYNQDPPIVTFLKRLVIFAAAAVCVLAIAVAVMHFTAEKAEGADIEPDYSFRVHPNDITNRRALQEMRKEKLDEWLIGLVEAEQARLEEERRAEEQAALEEQASYYYDDNSTAAYDSGYYGGGIYYAPYSSSYNTNGPSRTMPGWHDGYLETYYNASSHYLASTWTLDDEGFYHDENGRYVVGVEISHKDEMPYGTIVDSGKGEGVVYDYGAGAEVHDFATNW